jgi:hypothetical protein
MRGITKRRRITTMMINVIAPGTADPAMREVVMLKPSVHLEEQ